MILSRPQMLAAEEASFSSGCEAEALMESAGRQMAEFVRQNHPTPGTCLAYAGKGHNGGDVLVAIRHLAQMGWAVEARLAEPDAMAPLTVRQFERIPAQTAGPGAPLVILDGLLGIGASGPPRGRVGELIQEINTLRRESSAWVLAADVPSGLDADSGQPEDPCVVADATVTMGFAKEGLVGDRATNYVGRLAVAALDGVRAPSDADPAGILTSDLLASMLPLRAFDTHKGMAGRVAIIAGSRGFTGAARLCSEAAVRGGAGLVTLFVLPENVAILAASVAPEVMVRPTASYAEVLEAKWDAIAIGPGLSTQHAGDIVRVIREAACPCVVDADALNVVARDPAVLVGCAGARLLTPHPGEMERLRPQGGRSRRDWLDAFVEKYPVTLLLKGSRTIIGEAGQPPAFNTTGHPGMASGGMGDVLTGVAAALIAQGRSPVEAAMLGAWICGRSAEIALTAGASQESLRASDVLAHLGAAFTSLRTRSF